MTFLNEPLHKIDSDVGSETLRKADLTGSVSPGARREPSLDASGVSADDETLEVVSQFERLYSDLAPAAAEDDEYDKGGLDDLVIEFPDEPQKQPPTARIGPRGRPRTVEPAYEPSREVVGGRSVFRAAEAPREEPTFTVDDAVALLRAAEKRAERGAPRAAGEDRLRDEVSPPVAAVGRAAPRLELKDPALRTLPDPFAPAAAASVRRPNPPDAHRTWMKVLVAGVVALMLGTGLGFVAGQRADTGIRPAIAVSEDGRPHLKVDYTLRK